MKLECRYCQNTDIEKFAKTKKGAICLCCYEKSVIETPENESERAQLAIITHLARGTGGNNRKFTNSYRALVNKAIFLESLPGKTPEQEIYARAYRDAINTFEEAAK